MNLSFLLPNCFCQWNPHCLLRENPSIPSISHLNIDLHDIWVWWPFVLRTWDKSHEQASPWSLKVVFRRTDARDYRQLCVPTELRILNSRVNKIQCPLAFLISGAPSFLSHSTAGSTLTSHWGHMFSPFPITFPSLFPHNRIPTVVQSL